MSTPTISIITPSFNQRDYVEACLESISAQTAKPVEHIIYDGGSTDGTLEVLKAYANAHDFVRLRVGKDSGQVDAINKGFREAKGDYLTWLNTDDSYIDSATLADIAACASESSDVAFLYGAGEFVSETGEYLRDVYINTDPDALTRRFMVSVGILQPATFIRREAFEALGELRADRPYCFDYEYWMRAAFAGRRFAYFDRKVCRATLHSNSKTVGQRGRSLLDTAEANRSYYGFVSCQWVDKIANHLVSGADGIVASEGAADMNIQQVRDREFFRLNGDKAAQEAILSRAHVPEAAATLKCLREGWGLDTRESIATAFDEKFFASGLTMIAGLHRLHDRARPVFVYDMGITQAQRALLHSLENVFVLDFQKDARAFFDDYFSTRSYGFKSYVAWHARSYLRKGDTLLWIDAGICPLTDLKRCFSEVELHDILLVDHDDKGIWPVYNITFTSDECVETLDATPEELMAPHLRAGFFGVKVGGRFDPLIEELFEFSLNPKALEGEKHPSPPIYKTRDGGTPEERRRAVEDPAWRDAQKPAKLRELFGYFGHRHDQAIMSILAARRGAPHRSATEFCVADNASSASSKARWQEAERVFEVSTELPLYYASCGAELMQHRGLYLNTDGVRFQRVQPEKTAIILGNGPSLKGFDFKRFEGMDVFGMNAAYRYWDEIGWRPQYYACVDLVVGLSHKEKIRELIENAHENGIRLFLLRENLVDALGPVANADRVVNYDELRRYSNALQALPESTGSHAAAWAAVLGYKNIYLLGIDCNYVEIVDGARATGVGTELEIVASAENPNYFFDGYQRPGDKYNIPNPDRDIHLTAWREVAPRVAALGARILNANLQSKVDAFDFCVFEDVEGEKHVRIIPRTDVLQPSGAGSMPVAEVAVGDAASAGRAGPDPSNENGGASATSAGKLLRVMMSALRFARRYLTSLLFGALALVLLAVASVADLGGARWTWAAIAGLGAVLMGACYGLLATAEASRRLTHYFRVLRSEFDEKVRAKASSVAVDQLARDVKFLSERGAPDLSAELHEFERRVTELEAALSDATARLSREQERVRVEVEAEAVKVRDELRAEAITQRNEAAIEIAALREVLEQKADIEHVSGLQVSVAEAADSARKVSDDVTQVLIELDTRATDEDLGALARASAKSVNELKQSKADRDEIERLERATKELADVVSAKAEKADLESLNRKTEDVADRMDAKAERDEIERLERGAKELADVVSAKAEKADLESLNRKTEGVADRMDAKADRGEIERLERATKELAHRIKTKAEKNEIDNLGRRIDAALSDVTRAKAETQALEALRAALEQRMEETDKRTEAVLADIQRKNSTFSDVTDEIGGKIDAVREELSKKQAGTDQALSELKRATDEAGKVSRLIERSPVLNAPRFTTVNRGFTPELAAVFQSTWAKPLGLKFTDRNLYYHAQRICALESRMRGRLAASIEDALVRTLCAAAVSGDELDVLEIGSLFGIGAAMIHDFGRNRFKSVRITLLDPLIGYYDASVLDVLSGVPVNEPTLRENMTIAGVPEDDYSLIARFSYEDAAIEEAGEKTYDVLIIDADHTYSGVKLDFEHYASMVRRGGFVIFDDYASPDWPDVAAFVDAEVMKDSRFSLVQKGWRTAVFRRVVKDV